MRAFNAATNTLWAMREEEMNVLLSIAARAQSDPDEALRQAQALAAKRSVRLDKTEVARRRDGIGILSIHDELFPRANLFSDISGGASCETLMQDFQVMLEDPAVTAIVLDVDSPGGDVTGTRSFAEHVYQARGKKPIVAYVDGLAASGAYWIASAADRIVIEPTAKLGSIGILASFCDTSEADAKRGLNRVTIASEQSPDKRPDLKTEEGRALVQKLVNETAEVFVSDVARNRKTTPAKVLSDFGRGWLVGGQSAVDAGLADSIGTLEGVVAELAEAGTRQAGFGGRLSAQAGGGGQMADWKWFEDGLKAIGWGPKEAEAKPDTKPPTATAPAPELTALQQQNATLQEQVNRLLAGQRDAHQASLAAQAREFAQSAAVLSRTYPHERADLLQALTDAATDDAANPRAAGTKSRLETLKAATLARPQHNLTTEMLQGRLPAGAMLLENSGGSGTSLTDEGAELGKKAATAANGKGGK